MRKKTVQITDGEKYVIGAFNLDQVEEITGPDFDKVGVVRLTFMAAMALNNALPANTSESEKWTEEKIRKEFDLVSIRQLNTEILEFNSLKTGQQEGEQQPGEEQSHSTSE